MLKRYRTNLRTIQQQYITKGRHFTQQELTEREHQVLQYGALGYTSAETGWAISISGSTVTKDIKRIDMSYGTTSSMERILTGAVLGDIDLVSAVDPEVIRRFGYIGFPPRERGLLRKLTEDLGKWSKATQLAEKLRISERTVDSHLQHIMNKLGVSNKRSIGIHAFVSFVSTGDYTLEDENTLQSSDPTVVFDRSSHISGRGV